MKHKKKLIIGILAVAVAVVIVVAAVNILLNSKDVDRPQDKQIPTYGYQNGNTSTLISPGVDPIEIKETKGAFISGDRKHTLSVGLDGSLTVKNIETGDEKLFKTEVQAIRLVGDKICSYQDEEGTHLYYYDEDRLLKLGNTIAITANDDESKLLYANEKGIYILSEDKKPKQISDEIEESDNIALTTLNEDGSIITWLREHDNQVQAYAFFNGNVEKIADFEYTSNTNNIFVYANPTQTISAHTDMESVVAVTNKKESVSYELEGTFAGIYTKNASLSDSNEDVSDLYLVESCVDLTKEESFLRVYYLKDGTKEEILHHVTDFSVCDGYAYYVEDDKLYQAKLKENTLSKAREIDTDVNLVQKSNRDGYVYYYKNINEAGEATLCVTKNGGQPEIIDSGVYASTVTNGQNYASGQFPLVISTDAKTCFYFKNVNAASGYNGTLYKYTYGEAEEKLCENVKIASLYPGTRSGFVKNQDITFFVYDNEAELRTFYEYDGNEVREIAKETDEGKSSTIVDDGKNSESSKENTEAVDKEKNSESSKENTEAVDNEKNSESSKENIKAGEEMYTSAKVDDSNFYAVEFTKESDIFKRIDGKSFKKDCNIPVSDLRYLHVMHMGFDGKSHEGEIICNKAIAEDLLEIFYDLYKAGYPIEKIKLVDEYDADDESSMSANNSSCFNYRCISHTNKVSKHGAGMAIDINPLYNPYVKTVDGALSIEPANGEPYVDRTKEFDYKIDENDLAYQLFTAHGFSWGGSWKSSKDYQHFEK